METLAKFNNQEEARIAMSYLRANGIDAALADADTFATIPNVGMGATMLRLQVPEPQIEEARALLDSVQDGSAAFSGEQLDEMDDFGEPEDKSDSDDPLLFCFAALSNNC